MTKIKKLLSVTVAILFFAGTFVACNGPSEEEMAQLNQLRQEVKSLEQQLADCKNQKSKIERDIADRQAQLDKVEKDKAETLKNLKTLGY
ncbi:MAG: hypothetical protein JXA68_01010 [Ignavibacteriales bacterium]|nr:hypothetical protein [Ignavibacteriales bacterium]